MTVPGKMADSTSREITYLEIHLNTKTVTQNCCALLVDLNKWDFYGIMDRMVVFVLKKVSIKQNKPHSRSLDLESSRHKSNRANNWTVHPIMIDFT